MICVLEVTSDYISLGRDDFMSDAGLFEVSLMQI